MPSRNERSIVNNQVRRRRYLRNKLVWLSFVKFGSNVLSRLFMPHSVYLLTCVQQQQKRQLERQDEQFLEGPGTLGVSPARTLHRSSSLQSGLTAFVPRRRVWGPRSLAPELGSLLHRWELSAGRRRAARDAPRKLLCVEAIPIPGFQRSSGPVENVLRSGRRGAGRR